MTEDLRDITGDPFGRTLEERIAEVRAELATARHGADYFGPFTSARADSNARAIALERELEDLLDQQRMNRRGQ